MTGDNVGRGKTGLTQVDATGEQMARGRAEEKWTFLDKNRTTVGGARGLLGKLMTHNNFGREETR